MTDLLNLPLILTEPRRLTHVSTWVGHIPFSFQVMNWCQPGAFVELGTFSGESYCAFCQAVDLLQLSTSCYAVDTWIGDEHAGNIAPYALLDLESHHDLYYSKFSTLLQMTFDEAAARFEDGSVDLLHIDGLHTYEAVRHDFETWLPKLSSRGAVLLHDTAVRDDGFGVWQYWEELSTQYPSFAFTHSGGLGVLAVGPECPKPVFELCALPPFERQKVANAFEAIGARYAESPVRLSEQLCEHIQAREPTLATPDAIVRAGNAMLALNMPEAARGQFHRAALMDPDNTGAAAGKVASLVALGLPARAEAALKPILANPEGVTRLMLLLNRLDHTEHEPGVTAVLEDVLAERPDNLQALVDLADLHFSNENYGGAAALFQRAHVLDPDNVDLISQLICCQVFLGKFARARGFCQKALQLAPDDPYVIELAAQVEELATDQ